MELVEKLNRFRVRSTVSKGVVTLKAGDLDSLCDEEEPVTEQEFSDFLTEMATYEAYLDEHPEGSDRGGHVVWVKHGDEKCYFYGPSGEWE